MKVELERTVAMVTVVVDGSGLNNNVSISIREVGLCNVPKNCMIGTGNNFDEYDYAKVSDYFVDKGEYKTPMQLENAVVTKITQLVHIMPMMVTIRIFLFVYV